jgi:hypothetical protein
MKIAPADAMVEVTILGEKQLVPVSVAAREFQTAGAAKKILDEAKSWRQENARTIAEAENWRTQQRQMTQDPDGFVRNTARLASLAKGAPVVLDETTRSESSSGADTLSEPGQTNPVLEQRLSELERRDQARQREQDEQRVRTEVQSAVNEYPLFRDNAKLRVNAERVALATLLTNREVDVRDAVRQHHADLVELNGGRTAIRDERARQVEAMPAVPAQVGSPPMSGAAAPNTDPSSLKTGDWARSARSYIEGLTRKVGL